MIGPTPIHTMYVICDHCIYHNCNLVVSGRLPRYANNCIHPKAFKNDAMFGNIGESSKTPDWCPVVNEKK